MLSRPVQARALPRRGPGADPALTRGLAGALSLATVLALGLALAGCNTVGGAGEDISAAGKAVTGTAEEVKKGP